MERGAAYYARRARWWLEYKKPRHDVTIPTENGLLTCSSKDWLIGKHLFTRRNYEMDFIRESVSFLREQGLISPEPRGTVVDIGANIGMISIAMLREAMFDRAIAFEPSPDSFRLLQKNVEQNDLADRFECFQMALSSKTGSVTFEIAEDNSGDSRVNVDSRPGLMGENFRRNLDVRSETFDTIVADGRVVAEEIEMMWIDIQGHEGHFFKGAKNFFATRNVPVVNEFWGYGIGRSGMNRDEYIGAVTENFSRMFIYSEGGFSVRPIAAIGDLFERFSQPREIANVILI